MAKQTRKEVINTWVIKFCDDYPSPHDLIRGYESEDRRLPNQRRCYLHVALSYVIARERPKALGVMERHFGQTRPRRTHRSIFDFIQQAR